MLLIRLFTLKRIHNTSLSNGNESKLIHGVYVNNGSATKNENGFKFELKS